MPQTRDAISVRTTRLNNVILGVGRCSGVDATVPEALTREGLLDALCVLYNECSKESLRKRDKNIADFFNKYRNVVEETRKLRVNVSDFSVRTLIGQGYFGNVHLVVERESGDVYAMKKIKKSVVTNSQVREERDIMSRRCSEWITNLQYAFQDNEHLYLVMEYVPGGDLLNLMSRHGPFDEDLARFYLAELTLAINALHSIGYVHRDIKPENILIDRFGHIKLADFGNAAALDRNGHVFSLSPVGTPDYIAPELLQTISTLKLTKSRHDVSCDYWSMGIIGYELICEVTPFHEDNVHETYSKILSHCEEGHSAEELISFPSELKLSANFKNFIGSLITNPSKRLNYDGIRKHPYFESIKWDTLRSQVPPIIPNLQSDDDTSNFEDAVRHKTRIDPLAKKPMTSFMSSIDFCGKDLPFIGYSFVHMERHEINLGTVEDHRFSKMNQKLKDMQLKQKEYLEEITKLKLELLRAEFTAEHSSAQSKIFQDAKDEMVRMKEIIKEKHQELAVCKTQIKQLQDSLTIEKEMWAKKETTIMELVRMNRRKFEESKEAMEDRYERSVIEKKQEIICIRKKLEERETELLAKSNECSRLEEKIENYKEMLRQQKEQTQRDVEEFEKSKTQLSETYEQKLAELRTKLRQEKNSRSRLTMELREVRTELDDSINTTRSSEVAKQASAKSNDEILKRLNREIEANNKLHAINTELEAKLSEAQKLTETLQQDVNRLERELKVYECSKSLAESALATQPKPSQYATAAGSLTDLHVVEEQLRADLETARENENVQKERADKLQTIVQRLEEMMEKFNEYSLSPTKPHPAPRHGQGTPQITSSVGDMLEKQNEKLEDRLAAVREQLVLERQSARTANLALWKAEKKLEEALAEHKMTQRRMELTEERIKKVQTEREEAQRLSKVSEEAKRLADERIEELKKDIVALKHDLLKEHRLWEKAEQERMQCKSEIIEHISNGQKLEEKLSEVHQKLKQSQQKCDALDVENKRLIMELNEERDKNLNSTDQISNLQIDIKNFKDNYERLKYACTVTDNQLTEVETMLETEQKLNKSQQEKLDRLYGSLRERDEEQVKLKKKLNEERKQKEAAELRVNSLTTELEEHRINLEELRKNLSEHQQQLKEQTHTLYSTQERVEVLQNELKNLEMLNENYERELNLLKEENARILSDLFHCKEEGQKLQHSLKDANSRVEELLAELEDMRGVLAEKENYYLQRDIKSEATLAQHKKLIDYLQLKVEDLTQKKKKTLADKLFGTSHVSSSSSSSSSSKKENQAPNAVESSILYRTLQEELKREKLRTKTLQEQIDKLSEKNCSSLRSPLKLKNKESNVQKSSESSRSPKSSKKSQSVAPSNNDDVLLHSQQATAKYTQLHHRFELALQETNSNSERCAACSNPVVAGAPYWKCRECKIVAHRKCRSDVVVACCGIAEILAAKGKEAAAAECTAGLQLEPSAPAACDLDTDSIGKYSYEGKLDVSDEAEASKGAYAGSLIYNVTQSGDETALEVSCAYELEEQKILLLGCNTGLYAYHIAIKRLIHIAGIDAVSCIAVSRPLAKVIMVGSHGESLYQCDFRHLQTRSQAISIACLQPALEASVLDLPFANRASVEKWQLVQISQETDQPLDTVAIAATSTRIVILKYDMKLHKFKPVRALDTATSVSSILYTRHTAIVSSDKFFEIDLSTYGAEEFVDVADQTLSHTCSCQPVVALRISRQEFLLCFMECGVFVDEYGCRSRPYDLNWEYTPTGFLYREPFLYIAHFQSVQVLRLHRSYSQEVANCASKDGDDTAPTLKRAYLSFYMPTLLAESGRLNAYTLAVQKQSGLQEIYHLDALQMFRQQHNESLETISSAATSVTVDSLANAKDV